MSDVALKYQNHEAGWTFKKLFDFLEMPTAAHYKSW